MNDPTSRAGAISTAGFVNLNVVRALSGLVVVVAHFFQLFVMPVRGRGMVTEVAVRAAEPAVFTFFLLSGLLISLSIQRNIEKNHYFAWRSYFVSRFARIYPALVASVALCILLRQILVWKGLGGAAALVRATDVYPVSRTEFGLSWYEVAHTLLQTYAFGPGVYMSVNGPLWSLSYEVGFYLAAGLLVTMLRGRGLARVVAAGGLTALIFISTDAHKYLFLHFGTLWLLGVGLFFLASSRLYAALLLIACTVTNLALAATNLDGHFMRNYLSSLLMVLVLLVLSRYRRVLLGGLAAMSESTYTLYLFHFPLLLFFYALIRDVHDQSSRLYFACAGLFTLAVIPACHALAKLLENRRRWEALLTRGRLRSVNRFS